MDCLFCKIVAGDIPAHTIYEDDHALAFLDIRPAGKGHTLVIPKEHAAELEDISPESLSGTIRAAQVVARTLRSRLRADGLNMFQNNGAAAGQEIFHYHLHLLPQWHGQRARLGGGSPADSDTLKTLAAELREQPR
jgi:histidine triad (HIT) family protein